MQDFIKVNERLGVVLKDLKDLEKVFLYFSEPETSLLNYKDFCKDIFKFSSVKYENRKRNRSYENRKNSNIILYENGKEEQKTFIEKLYEKIMINKGIFSLLEIIKNLQIIDYEGSKRISVDDFLLALKRSNIILQKSDVEKIFQEYEFFIDGVVRYSILINLLLDKYWNEEKDILSCNIYYILTNNEKRYISLNSLQELFENILENSNEKRVFINFINNYKIINKNNTSLPMTLKDTIQFLKFYNFGQRNSFLLKDLLSVIEPERENESCYLYNHYYKNRKNVNDDFINIKRKYPINSINKWSQKYCNENLHYIMKYLRNILIKYGRNTFFNLIKHFKYYDDNSRCISRNDFAKVFFNYNIKLTPEEVDNIFEIFKEDKTYNIINYQNFLSCMISTYCNQKREEVIRYIYNTILERGEKFMREADLTFLKEIYNPKNNYFIKDESENRLEFENCLELYHHCYKGFKGIRFSKNEFEEFYRFLSFLIQSDSDFILMISNEWRVPFEYIKDYLNLEDNDNKNKKRIWSGDKSLQRPKKNNYIEDILDSKNYFVDNNEKNFSILLLRKKLKSIGVSGLLELHWQFIVSCEEVMKINIIDFTNILKNQHFLFKEQDYINIFNYFVSTQNSNYLDFNRFIRYFKKKLTKKKLEVVEKIFIMLTNEEEDDIPLDKLKKMYNAKNHPDVLKGEISEEEKVLEFLESFDTNYAILNQGGSRVKGKELIDFEIFANFYEYVSFIYPDNDEFKKVLTSTWC